VLLLLTQESRRAHVRGQRLFHLRSVHRHLRADDEVGVRTRPSNKGMKLTKPGELRSFAAYPRCWADQREVNVGPTRVAAQHWPRDMVDWLLCAALTPAYAALFVILPGLAGYWGMRLAGVPERWWMLSALALALFVVILVALLHVERLEVDPEGLRFVRRIGYPRRLRWSEIIEIVPVGRCEVLLRGWLSWPPEEPTTCMSSVGHYRIRFVGGVVYYPPKDAAQFEALIGARGSRPTRG
jgi:hypothetical protein